MIGLAAAGTAINSVNNVLLMSTSPAGRQLGSGTKVGERPDPIAAATVTILRGSRPSGLGRAPGLRSVHHELGLLGRRIPRERGADDVARGAAVGRLPVAKAQVVLALAFLEVDRQLRASAGEPGAGAADLEQLGRATFTERKIDAHRLGARGVA